MTVRFEVIEDNGGGLHLFVFINDEISYYANGYEYHVGQLSEDIKYFMDDGNTNGWEVQTDFNGTEYTPTSMWEAYEELTSSEYGWELVAEGNYSTGDKKFYWDRMGSAASKEFRGW